MDRRHFLPLLGGLAGTLAGCRRRRQPQELLVSVFPGMMVSPVYLADELGYFREAGMQVDIRQIRESAQAIPLLADGQLDATFLSITPAFINAVYRGARVRVVAAREVMTLNCGAPGRVYGSRKAFPKGLEDLHQLKGKRVAVYGTTTHVAFILDVLLESAGMSTGDVTVVNLRRSEAFAALVGGTLDAMVFSDYEAEPESISGALVRGPSAEKLLQGLQTTFVIFGRKLLDGDQAVGIGFLWAYLRGVEAFRAGKIPRVFDELAQGGGLDPAKARSVCRDQLSTDGVVDRSSVQRLVDWSVKKGFVGQPVDASRLIETRFVEGALGRLGRSPK